MIRFNRVWCMQVKQAQQVVSGVELGQPCLAKMRPPQINLKRQNQLGRRPPLQPENSLGVLSLACLLLLLLCFLTYFFSFTSSAGRAHPPNEASPLRSLSSSSGGGGAYPLSFVGALGRPGLGLPERLAQPV